MPREPLSLPDYLSVPTGSTFEKLTGGVVRQAPGRRTALLSVPRADGGTERFVFVEKLRSGEVTQAYIKRGFVGEPGIQGRRGEIHDGHVHWERATSKNGHRGRPGFRDDIYGTAELIKLKGSPWAVKARDPRGAESRMVTEFVRRSAVTESIIQSVLAASGQANATANSLLSGANNPAKVQAFSATLRSDLSDIQVALTGLTRRAAELQEVAAYAGVESAFKAVQLSAATAMEATRVAQGAAEEAAKAAKGAIELSASAARACREAAIATARAAAETGSRVARYAAETTAKLARATAQVATAAARRAAEVSVMAARAASEAAITAARLAGEAAAMLATAAATAVTAPFR